MIQKVDENKALLESVDGIEIKVEKYKKEFSLLPVKEWLLAKIVDVKKRIPTIKSWSPSLHWTFLILEENLKNRKIWHDTSIIATVDSKFYSLYTEVMGLSDIADGTIIKPSDLLEKMCYIMIDVSKKKKDFQVVSAIKHYVEVKEDIKKTVDEIKTAENLKEKSIKNSAEEESDDLNLEDINLDEL